MKIIYTERAADDLGALASYLTLRSPQGSRNVRAAIQKALASLSMFPRSGRMQSVATEKGISSARKATGDRKASRAEAAMRRYIALIHKDADSDFGVSFPDLPGCVSASATLDEAREMAAEALTLHLTGLAEAGGPFPEPASLDDIMADAVNRDGVAILVAPR